MRKAALLLSMHLLGFALASADETRLAVFLQGNRIGSSTYSSRKDVLNGKELNRGDSTSTMAASMLGGDLKIEMNSTTWTEASGRPVKMVFVTKSAGRTQTVQADFGAEFADVSMVSGGEKQRSRLKIPTDGPIVDDPMPLVLKSGVDSKMSFYVLRPDTLSFVKDTAVNRGASKVTVGTRTLDATLVEVIDPMATMKVYVGSDGQLVKAIGPLGIEMLPESIAPESTGSTPDIATASAITPDKPIANPRWLKRFKFDLVSPGVGELPSDAHQTAVKNANGWSVDVHPVDALSSPGLTIAQAAKQQPEWIKPDTYIPSDSARFKALAKKIVGNRTRVRDAALSVQSWVAGRMQPNPGIGVLRDASEVLSSKEGVCRDYAILSATLLRAAGIPTRLCSGLVSWDGTFYYHAWVEVWNGKNWIGVDSTVRDQQMSAGHIKLSDGNIATAFRFPVLDKVSIKVREAVSR